MANAERPDFPENYILPERYCSIHLEGLNNSARRKISLYLNLEGTLLDDIGCMNNYEGLAEKVGFTYIEIKNFERQRNPTEQLLSEWTSRTDLSPTIGTLWNYLKEMERFDVLTESWTFIRRDCDNYIKMKSRFQKAEADEPLQDKTVTQSTEDADHFVDDSAMMTVDDVALGARVKYDAFVCYNPEGEDLEFVREMIDKLEVKHGLKLFIPWRDDLPGASQSTISAKLIEQRCRRMCILLSPRFLKSPSCDFQIKFAHSLSPGSRSKKLIPILLERCEVPQIIRHVTLCDHTKKELRDWFWTRLLSSLKAPIDSEEIGHVNSQLLSSTNLDTSYNSSQVSVYAWSYLGSSSMSDYAHSGSNFSNQSLDSSYLSPSSDDYASSGSNVSNQSLHSSYIRPIADRETQQNGSKKSDDYELIGNLRRKKNESCNEKPKSPATKSRWGWSPAQRRRPVPPLPQETETRKETQQTEHFC